MFNKTILLLFFTLTLVNSTSYKGKKTDCSKIKCGKDCQGSCGWSSIYHKCKYGFTTSKHELNKGPGCKTKSNDDSKDVSEDESEDSTMTTSTTNTFTSTSTITTPTTLSSSKITTIPSKKITFPNTEYCL